MISLELGLLYSCNKWQQLLLWLGKVHCCWELGERDESALVPAFRQLLASLIGSAIASLQVCHSFSETVLRGGIADSGGESGKAAWRGRHLYAQHITLVRRESKHHLCLPRSIWDAETETAAFPALLPKWRDLEVLFLLLIQPWAFFRPSWAPEEPGAAPLNNTIKMLPKKKLKPSGWGTDGSTSAKRCELGTRGRGWLLSGSVPAVVGKSPYLRVLVFSPVRWNDWHRWWHFFFGHCFQKETMWNSSITSFLRF